LRVVQQRGPFRGAPALAAFLLLCLSAVARADTAGENLKTARDSFDFGDFASVVRILERETDIEGMQGEADRIEAYRLLGLSHYFLSKPAVGPAPARPAASTDADRRAARAALFNLLKQNPDYQLDPVFVPPDAVAFFETIRREEEPVLGPIRRYRKAAEDTPRGPPVPPVVVDHKIAVSSPVVALLPFGLGQFQNGNVGLGVGMAVGQGLGALTSILSFVMVDVLKDPSSNEYKAGNYALANNFYIAQWVGAAVFYGLWIAGAIEASIRYVPERTVGADELSKSVIRAQSLPSAAPAGPLKPPAQERPAPVPPSAPPAKPPGLTPPMNPPALPPAAPRVGDSASETRPVSTALGPAPAAAP
jgi:hypothetical protein